MSSVVHHITHAIHHIGHEISHGFHHVMHEAQVHPLLGVGLGVATAAVGGEALGLLGVGGSTASAGTLAAAGTMPDTAIGASSIGSIATAGATSAASSSLLSGLGKVGDFALNAGEHAVGTLAMNALSPKPHYPSPPQIDEKPMDNLQQQQIKPKPSGTISLLDKIETGFFGTTKTIFDTKNDYGKHLGKLKLGDL